jgi:DNA-binding IscR family transcriptional regulator
MKILKSLHQHGILTSTRGVKGGYQVAVNLDDLSLGRLIAIVDGNGNSNGKINSDEELETGATPRRLSMQPPVQALQYKLVRVLHDVKVTDLVKPGRRIDVPWERVWKSGGKQTTTPIATSA